MKKVFFTLTVLLLLGFPIVSNAQNTDSDQDGVLDMYDNCLHVKNGPNDASNQIDIDLDGYGNVCDSDITNDGTVNLNDFNAIILNMELTAADPEFKHIWDINHDGEINLNDFNAVLLKFNTSPGPSGLSCAGTPEAMDGTVPCVADFQVDSEYQPIDCNDYDHTWNKIYTESELRDFLENGEHFGINDKTVLCNNIELDFSIPIIPFLETYNQYGINPYNLAFAGTFHGGNYTILNLKIQGQGCNSGNGWCDKYAGMFAAIKESAHISHLNISNVNVSNATILGSIVGSSLGKIEDVKVHNTSFGSEEIEHNFILSAGGVVGSMIYGSLERVKVTNDQGYMVGNSEYFIDYAGGLVGGIGFDSDLPYQEVTISQSSAHTKVLGGYVAGGLVGSSSSSPMHMKESKFVGDLIVSGCGYYTSAGGLVGQFAGETPAQINNSYALSEMFVQEDMNCGDLEYAGGLVGLTYHENIFISHSIAGFKINFKIPYTELTDNHTREVYLLSSMDDINENNIYYRRFLPIEALAIDASYQVFNKEEFESSYLYAVYGYNIEESFVNHWDGQDVDYPWVYYLNNNPDYPLPILSWENPIEALLENAALYKDIEHHYEDCTSGMTVLTENGIPFTVQESITDGEAVVFDCPGDTDDGTADVSCLLGTLSVTRHNCKAPCTPQDVYSNEGYSAYVDQEFIHDEAGYAYCPVDHYGVIYYTCNDGRLEWTNDTCDEGCQVGTVITEFETVSTSNPLLNNQTQTFSCPADHCKPGGTHRVRCDDGLLKPDIDSCEKRCLTGHYNVGHMSYHITEPVNQDGPVEMDCDVRESPTGFCQHCHNYDTYVQQYYLECGSTLPTSSSTCNNFLPWEHECIYWCEEIIELDDYFRNEFQSCSSCPDPNSLPFKKAVLKCVDGQYQVDNSYNSGNQCYFDCPAGEFVVDGVTFTNHEHLNVFDYGTVSCPGHTMNKRCENGRFNIYSNDISQCKSTCAPGSVSINDGITLNVNLEHTEGEPFTINCPHQYTGSILAECMSDGSYRHNAGSCVPFDGCDSQNVEILDGKSIYIDREVIEGGTIIENCPFHYTGSVELTCDNPGYSQINDCEYQRFSCQAGTYYLGNNSWYALSDSMIDGQQETGAQCPFGHEGSITVECQDGELIEVPGTNTCHFDHELCLNYNYWDLIWEDQYIAAGYDYDAITNFTVPFEHRVETGSNRLDRINKLKNGYGGIRPLTDRIMQSDHAATTGIPGIDFLCEEIFLELNGEDINRWQSCELDYMGFNETIYDQAYEACYPVINMNIVKMVPDNQSNFSFNIQFTFSTEQVFGAFNWFAEKLGFDTCKNGCVPGEPSGDPYKEGKFERAAQASPGTTGVEDIDIIQTCSSPPCKIVIVTGNHGVRDSASTAMNDHIDLMSRELLNSDVLGNENVTLIRLGLQHDYTLDPYLNQSLLNNSVNSALNTLNISASNPDVTFINVGHSFGAYHAHDLSAHLEIQGYDALTIMLDPPTVSGAADYGSRFLQFTGIDAFKWAPYIHDRQSKPLIAGKDVSVAFSPNTHNPYITENGTFQSRALHRALVSDVFLKHIADYYRNQ